MIPEPGQHGKKLFFLGVLLLALVACATAAPVQEMSNARQALQAAERANAEKYAPELLKKARLFLEQAADELEAEQYELARDHAREAQQLAVEARQQALSLQNE